MKGRTGCKNREEWAQANSKLKSQLVLKAIYSAHNILDFLELKRERERRGERGEKGNFRYYGSNFQISQLLIPYVSTELYQFHRILEILEFYLAFMECLIFVKS